MNIIQDEIKNPRTIIILVLAVILFIVYSNGAKKVTEIETKYQQQITVLTETITKDSVSLIEKSRDIDSMSSYIKKKTDSSSTHGTIKNGKSTETITETTTKPNGETTTKVIVKEIDTTYIDTGSVKYVTVYETQAQTTRIKELETKLTALSDSIGKKKTDSNTKAEEKVVITEPVKKKLDLGASFGIDAGLPGQRSDAWNTTVGVSAKYDVAAPIFIEANVIKNGNPITYTQLTDYRVGFAVGLHFGI